METFIHELDKTNFFYEDITTLAYAQYGFNELFSRGFYRQKRTLYPEWLDFVEEISRFPFPQDVKDEIFNTNSFTPNIFVPGFLTSDGKRIFRMDPTDSADQFLVDTKGLTNANIRLTHLTILSAYEKVMNAGVNESTPTLQFFRHIRNASAHNGKFRFDPKAIDKVTGKLKKEAKWNVFIIEPNLQEVRLIYECKDDRKAFWDQGDLVEFLLDFENHHPEIKSTIPNQR